MMSEIELIEGATPEAIADWVESKLTQALAATQRPIAITIPGGSTPFPIFEILAKRAIDWSRITIWPSDDRIVPDDHPASNSGKMRAIFEPAGAKVVHLTGDGIPPPFALAWLGMGGDGHIASLFPSTDPQPDDTELVRVLTPNPLPPEAPYDRISLTMPALLKSGQLVIVLGGSALKRAVFDEAQAGDNDLPIARLLRSADQPITCFS